MNYRSIAELNDTVVRWTAALPSDIELVVGVPRSGLLVANLLSMYLNLPMTDVDGLVSGRVLRAGARYKGESGSTLLSRPRNVLVVDDSVSYGGQMGRVRREIADADLPHRIDYAAVYITPEARDERLVDHFCEVVARPRVFEWNLMHNQSLLARSCISIEGVLCPLDSAFESAGEEASSSGLDGVEPLWIPDHPVGWLLSTQSEASRPRTEDWLASHGVDYTRLVMRGEHEGWSERAGEKDVWFKAEIYESSGADILIDGSLEVCCKVASLLGKPAYCTTTREMVRPGMSPKEGRRLRSPLAWSAVQTYHRIIRIPRLAAKRVVSRTRRYLSGGVGNSSGPTEPKAELADVEE